MTSGKRISLFLSNDWITKPLALLPDIRDFPEQLDYVYSFGVECLSK